MSTARMEATEPGHDDLPQGVASSADVAAGVRRQAQSIMEHVMQSAPAGQRELLLSYQQAFAGRPELALAEFLRAVRPSISDYNEPRDITMKG